MSRLKRFAKNLFRRCYYTQVSQSLIAGIFRRGQEEKVFRKKVFRNDFNPNVAAPALWGTSQGMIKDKLYAEKVSEFPNLGRIILPDCRRKLSHPADG